MARGVAFDPRAWDEANQDLHDKCLYPTLRVQSRNSTGSGTIIYCGDRTEPDEDGELGFSTYALTNHHVVSSAIRVEKKFDPQRGKEVTRDYRDFVQIEAYAYKNRCVSPETLVLREDMSWAKAGDLEVGDRLIAFDEYAPGWDEKRGSARHFRIATVEATGREPMQAYELEFADGTILVVSEDHPMLVGQWGSGSLQSWKTPMEMEESLSHFNRKNPVRLPRLVEPHSMELSYESGFLAAAFDGEGSISGSILRFAQRDNEMRAAVVEMLGRKGFDYGVDESELRDNLDIWINGGRQELTRFLQQFAPPRLLREFSERLGGFSIKSPYVDLVGLRRVGEQEMVTLQTDTKTYITEGFGSHNSTITSRTTADAEIMAYHEKRDIALLRLRTNQKFDHIATILPKEESKEIHVFDPLYIVGCGLGQPPFPTSGMLTGKDVQIDNFPYWQTSAPSIYGNSGGAVYRGESLEFMGIPSRISVRGGMFSSDAITHIGYFCPPLEIHKFLNEQGFHFLVDSSHTEAQDLKAIQERGSEDEDDD